MTHTAEPMTPEMIGMINHAVSQWKRDKTDKRSIAELVRDEVQKALDAELAKQRDAEPASVLGSNEVEWLEYAIAHMLDDSEPEDKTCTKVLQHLLDRNHHPQQRNAVDVTDSQFQVDLESAAGSLVEACGVEESGNILKDIYSALKRMEKFSAKNVSDEMVDLALDIWFNGDGDWRGYPQGEAECYRHDMRAALSAVASWDREDAERYLWILNNVDRIETDGWIWEREAVGDGMQIDLHERIDAIRRENKP